MLQNYLKIALRSLFRQKGLSLINVLGLSIGIACFSLFLLYAVNEFSFDRFHANGDRLYRMYRWTEYMGDQDTEGDPYLPMPLGPALKTDLPDVEQFARLKGSWGESFVRANGAPVTRIGIHHADPAFLQMFSFSIKYGDPHTALASPRNLVLTEKAARKLFNESNPVGKALEVKVDDVFEPFNVAAVMADLPPNTNFSFEILGSFEWYAGTKHGMQSQDKWSRSFLQTFVQLRPGSGLAGNAATLQNFRKKYYPDEEAELRKGGDWKGNGPPISYRLQALREMHTSITVGGTEVPTVNPKDIFLLLQIAAGVLLIACINFTTLAIGRSAGRAKEVGVRKVIGGQRRQLTGQFLTESLVLSTLSAGLGLALAQALLPYFNELSGRELTFSLSTYPEIGWMLAGLTLLVGLLAGSYPALVLSGFKPVEVLKSKVRLGGSNVFTKSLVTLQFVLSVGLIACTLVVTKQTDFMRTKNPGFDKENVVVVDADGTDTKLVWRRFNHLIAGKPQIIGAASADMSFGEGTGWSRSGFDYHGENKEVHEYFIDHNYLTVMGMQLLAGRNFDPGIAADTLHSVIVNEAFLRDFKWTAEGALGQPIDGYYEDSAKQQPVVVGVVKDFHFRPMSEEVKPQLFHQYADYAPMKFLVRIPAGDPAPALSELNNAWAAVVPELPFKYSFLNEDLDRFYRAEQRFGSIVAWAGGISIFLACLGLLGLAALAAANRTKEIGIRRVLGATVAGITGLLSKEFIRLVGLAILIATPLAWWLMQSWLKDFAYRIDMPWWVFAFAGVAAVSIALLTVGVQGMKAALADPVKSLRSE